MKKKIITCEKNPSYLDIKKSFTLIQHIRDGLIDARFLKDLKKTLADHLSHARAHFNDPRLQDAEIHIGNAICVIDLVIAKEWGVQRLDVCEILLQQYMDGK